MSARAMAVFFQGMTPEKRSISPHVESGRSEIPCRNSAEGRQAFDGGIGDKTSLILAPLLACGDCWVPMISGAASHHRHARQAEHRGSTLISTTPALAQLKSIGVHGGQTATFVRRTKHMRCATTGTVPSQPLIVASIRARSSRTPGLPRARREIRDRRVQKTRKEAQQLAAAIPVGDLMGVKATPSEPDGRTTGRTVGNALEVSSAVSWAAVEDLVKLVLDLAKVSTRRDQLETWLKDGTAWRKFISLVYAQDGDASSLEKLSEFHRAPVIHPYVAKASGKVTKMDAETIGRVSLLLGGGRKSAEDEIDFAVGLSGIKKIGERVEKGEPLFNVHVLSR